MTGWNLPPGCEESDLPGNSGEDQAWEELFEWLGNIGLTPDEIKRIIEKRRIKKS